MKRFPMVLRQFLDPGFRREERVMVLPMQSAVFAIGGYFPEKWFAFLKPSGFKENVRRKT